MTWNNLTSEYTFICGFKFQRVSINLTHSLSKFFLSGTSCLDVFILPVCLLKCLHMVVTITVLSPQTMDLHSCPKPIVFVLHTFLSAKVTRMGLLVWAAEYQKRALNVTRSISTSKKKKKAQKESSLLSPPAQCLDKDLQITAEP